MTGKGGRYLTARCPRGIRHVLNPATITNMPAAKERPEVFPLVAVLRLLPENCVRGLGFEKQTFIGSPTWLSSTSRWGCGYRCDGTASESSVGRFNTVDPYQASAGAGDPGSWNRYAYVGGDPVNFGDWSGLQRENCGDAYAVDASLSGPCYESGGGFRSALGGTCVANIAGLGFSSPFCYAPAPFMNPEATSSTAPPCWHDGGRMKQTLTDLSSNITSIAGAFLGGSELANLSGLISTMITFEMEEFLEKIATGSVTPSGSYNGGHFNLRLPETTIRAAMGAANFDIFLAAFGGSLDGTRQDTVYGTGAQGNYTLHSKEADGWLNFHFDIYNPLSGNPINLVGHLFGDVIGGHIGSPCLDPAWRH
jgi:hypothetical protein